MEIHVLCVFVPTGSAFLFFKQKTAYEMRISDWIQTCALPIWSSPTIYATGFRRDHWIRALGGPARQSHLRRRERDQSSLAGIASEWLCAPSSSPCSAG